MSAVIKDEKVVSVVEESGMNEDLKRGLKCSHMGKKVSDMSSEELISFIGMLDLLATDRQLKINLLEEAA